MITHSYRCHKCSNWFDVTWIDSSMFVREVDCECGGTAVQTWREAPGLSGVEEPSTRGVKRTFEPGFDIQAGRYFHSRSDRERWATSRGLFGLSPEEFKRSVKQSTPEPRLEGLGEAMEKSWQELKAGKPAPPMGKVNPNEVALVKEK